MQIVFSISLAFVCNCKPSKMLREGPVKWSEKFSDLNKLLADVGVDFLVMPRTAH